MLINKNYKRFNWFALFLCFLTACRPEVKIISTNVSHETLFAINDSVPFSVPNHDAIRTLVYKDSILVQQNKKTAKSEYITFTALHTGEIVHSSYKYGSQEGELLSANITLNGSIFTIFDFVKGNFYQLDLDMIYKRQQPYVNEYSTNLLTQGYALKDSKIIYLNPYYHPKNASYYLSSKLLVYDQLSYTPIKPKLDRYDTYDIVKGNILINTQTNNIYLVDKHAPMIELYSETLKLKRQIMIEDTLSASYGLYKNQILFKNYIPLGFIADAHNENYALFVYAGTYLDAAKNIEVPYNKNSTIYMFDWNGDNFGIFETGKKILDISLSIDDGIYCWEINDAGHKLLSKYYINKRTPKRQS